MSADPIIERIAQDIQAAVAGITQAAGYNQDLVCKRPARLGLEGDVSPADGVAVLVQDDPQPDEAHSNYGNPDRMAWLVTFEVDACVVPADADDTPIDTLLSRVRADIEKAVMADETRGGLAVWTKPLGSMRFAYDAGLPGIAVQFQVLYRTPSTDPYTSAG